MLLGMHSRASSFYASGHLHECAYVSISATSLITLRSESIRVKFPKPRIKLLNLSQPLVDTHSCQNMQRTDTLRQGEALMGLQHLCLPL